MDMVTFSERLAKLRIAKGVSARDMSLSIGQSANYINKIENQKAFPSMSVFFYVCEYLGITEQEFFDIETQNPILLNELIHELRGLDDTLLQNFLSIVKELYPKK